MFVAYKVMTLAKKKMSEIDRQKERQIGSVV